MKSLNFLKQNVLISGASSGLGKKVALYLSQNGSSVTILGRNKEKLNNSLKELKILDYEQQHHAFPCDVSSLSSLNETLKEVESKNIKFQTIINCAGINHDSLLLRTTEEDIQNIINTNLIGTIQLTKVFTRNLLKSSNGCIINIGSVVGSHGNVGQTVYSASKSGLIGKFFWLKKGFTKSLAKELGPRGVRVNLIEPGFFVTEMTSHLNEKKKEEIINQTILKRFGNDQDITSTVSFLMENQYITGQVISVDGGMFL